MNTSHIPGPWYVVNDTEVQSAVINKDNYVCAAEGNTMEQAIANAQLIACAPELLEVCHRALITLHEDDFSMLREELRQIITKATGEEP